MIVEQLNDVEARILRACERAGRSREEVTLIAVSKTKPNEVLQEVYNQGIRVFGENKVQELAGKIETLPEDIQWHMIGHLQTNKIKYIVGKVELIHSVDSVKLAKAIDKESEKAGCISSVLLEVNVAEEESKFGFRVEEVLDSIEQIAKLPHIKVCGLMTIAPYVDDPEENRPHFAKLHKLSVDIMQKNVDNINMNVLSMGMTNDFEIAIQEGATMVRVGTAIFGERHYN